jgi:hypothetical protein
MRLFRICFFVFCALVPLLFASAEPLTFQFQSGSINGQLVSAGNDWQVIDGARFKILPNGMPDSANANDVGIFWIGPIKEWSGDKDFQIVINGRFCISQECANGTFSGTLTDTKQGFTWTLIPNASTFGNLTITPITNSPNGNYNSTRDLNLTGSPVPEPMTLATLGAGLAGLAGLFRKKSPK